MATSNYRTLGILGFALLLPLVLAAHGVSSADQQTLADGGLGAYIWIGAKHMLTGYDHLLFLAGVMFMLQGMRDVVRFITAFTIGHSITLIGATYLGFQVDEHLIDGVIALSVVYKGFENLGGFDRLGVRAPNLLAMVFSFGLIHGLGLSTRLQQLGLGTEQVLLKIVSFNVGVELGQILALVPIVFAIAFWRPKPSYPAFYKAVNTYLVLAGIGLFVWQMWGYYTA